MICYRDNCPVRSMIFANEYTAGFNSFWCDSACTCPNRVLTQTIIVWDTETHELPKEGNKDA